MKRIRQSLWALVAALALMVTLTACDSVAGATGFDATLYVRGLLDETYLGHYDPAFLDLTETDKKAAQAVYASNIEAEYLRFAEYFSLDDRYLTEDTREGIQELLRNVYANAKYSVEEATALKKGEFSVKVTFHPLTIFSDFHRDDFDALLAEFEKGYEDHTPEKLAEMTEREQRLFLRVYEEDWAQQVLEALEKKLTLVGYGDPVTRLILVYPDQKGLYTISDTDYYAMDDLILDY